LVRSILSVNTAIQKTLLALVLAGVLLALWPSLAESATTFTVNHTGDAPDRKITDMVCDTSSKSGKQCTLRAAIQESNDTPGPDTINFNIGGTASVKTISPTSPLPPIKKAVTINGYTQPGASANNDCSSTNAVLKIELSGANAGPSANGLTITAADSTIKGLAINRFDGHGILVEGARATNNSIEGNYVGTDASGNINLGNGDDGTHIGANAGVYVKGAANNTVGGTAPASRNVISANSDSGVYIEGTAATNNKVNGNYIGTDASGTQRTWATS